MFTAETRAFLNAFGGTESSMTGRTYRAASADMVHLITGGWSFWAGRFVDRYLDETHYQILGPDAKKIVVTSLLASSLLESVFDRGTWAASGAYHPATFMPLPDEQADLVLGIGVVSGVLIDHGEGQYGVAGPRLKAEMAEAFAWLTLAGTGVHLESNAQPSPSDSA